MDLQFIVTVNVMAISAIAIVAAIPQRRATDPAWFLVNTLVLAIGAVSLVGLPEWAGAVTSITFAAFVAAPALLVARANQALERADTSYAARLNRYAALLMPSPIRRFGARLVDAIAELDRTGDLTRLDTLVEAAPTSQRAAALAQRALVTADWEKVLALIRANPQSLAVWRPMEIRVLGELGQFDEMCAVVEQLDRSGALVGHVGSHVRMVVLAFHGRREDVERWIAHSGIEDDDTNAYWRAVATVYDPASRHDGRAALEKLATTAARQRTRTAAAAALAHLDETASPTSGRDTAWLDALAERPADPPRRGVRHLPVSLGLIVLNLVMFVVAEVKGGSEELRTLVELGALWPDFVVRGGEWWRLVATPFLHFGPVHLGINLLALFVLGRALEPQLGPWRMFAIYLVGAVGSTAAVLGLMLRDVLEMNVLVGASGAVFTLVGVMAALALRRWRRRATVQNRTALIAIVTALAIQVAIDFSLPQVSFSAHAAGFLIGLAYGFVVPLPASADRRVLAGVDRAPGAA
jgi:membrane associated rhomboid family serine protease